MNTATKLRLADHTEVSCIDCDSVTAFERGFPVQDMRCGICGHRFDVLARSQAGKTGAAEASGLDLVSEDT